MKITIKRYLFHWIDPRGLPRARSISSHSIKLTFVMSSRIFSTKCFIKEQSFDLRICIDQDFVSTIDDLLVNMESTSDILNSFQLQFERLADQKTCDDNDEIVPEIIPLKKLFSIKTKRDSSESSDVELSYVDISEIYLWRVKRIQLKMDSTVADQLIVVLPQFLAKLKHRPRHLLVFLNPQCGKNDGCSVYEKDVSPLFKEANIDVETISTERANHAHDYILEQSLDSYDGLICVGGDGMFSELCHSLLLKTTQQAGLNIDDPNIDLKRPNLRIGVIPSGSTDAVVFGTTGHNDPITSALQIITGESLLIDIATVHSEHRFVRFLATMLAYGFFGNIIKQSDQWRVFGPLRYTLAGIFQFLENQSYPVELTIIPASEQKPLTNDHQQNSPDPSIRRREVSNNKCQINATPHQIKRKGRYRTINCLNMPGRCEKSKYGMSPSVHLSDGSFDLVLVKSSWYLNFLRFLHHAARDGRTIDELSNVERFRATEVFIHPIDTREKDRGNWACDGEVIKVNQARIRAHHRILNLFASGIRLDQIKKINEENSKIISISTVKQSQWIFRIIPFIFLLLLLFVLCYSSIL